MILIVFALFCCWGSCVINLLWESHMLRCWYGDITNNICPKHDPVMLPRHSVCTRKKNMLNNIQNNYIQFIMLYQHVAWVKHNHYIGKILWNQKNGWFRWCCWLLLFQKLLQATHGTARTASMCPFCAQGVSLALKMKELVHGFNIINKCIHVLYIYIYIIHANIYYVYIYIYIRATPGFCPGVAA